MGNRSSGSVLFGCASSNRSVGVANGAGIEIHPTSVLQAPYIDALILEFDCGCIWMCVYLDGCLWWGWNASKVPLVWCHCRGWIGLRCLKCTQEFEWWNGVGSNLWRCCSVALTRRDEVTLWRGSPEVLAKDAMPSISLPSVSFSFVHYDFCRFIILSWLKLYRNSNRNQVDLWLITWGI